MRRSSIRRAGRRWPWTAAPAVPGRRGRTCSTPLTGVGGGLYGFPPTAATSRRRGPSPCSPPPRPLSSSSCTAVSGGSPSTPWPHPRFASPKRASRPTGSLHSTPPPATAGCGAAPPPSRFTRAATEVLSFPPTRPTGSACPSSRGACACWPPRDPEPFHRGPPGRRIAEAVAAGGGVLVRTRLRRGAGPRRSSAPVPLPRTHP